MRSHKFSARDRVEALEALNAGQEVADICAALDISVSTLYGWKKAYSGLSIEVIEKLDQLTRENAELRRSAMVLELDIKILQEALQMQMLRHML